MKIVMVYDQIQAGMGTKDNADLPLGGTTKVIGPAIMMAPYLKEIDGIIIACIYVGTAYYKQHNQIVHQKLFAMLKKLSPDVILCGPAFDNLKYGELCANITMAIQANTSYPVCAMMAKENKHTIEAHQAVIPILKMPAKGEVGLNEALHGACLMMQAYVTKKHIQELEALYRYQ